MTDAKIIDSIETSEGWPKFTDRPHDLGGPTKGGITLDTLRVWRNNPTATVADLQALERPEARAVYQFMFLQPFDLLRAVDEPLRHYCIDLGVLRGPRKAAIMLQEIVGVVADGWVGPKTVVAIGPFKEHLLVMMIGARFTHIEARVKENPTQRTFRAGWRARNARFLP